jgi:cation diffusion facilitator CzcD-associated flavoprotein CzcO
MPSVLVVGAGFGDGPFSADVLVPAVGQLSEPHVPALPGAFAGPTFHSARWDHDVPLAPGGVRTTDGRLHEADVLVYGTGFRATDFVSTLGIRGPHGTLSEAWAEGAHAYLGITVPGFPNMFLMYGPNTNLGTGSILYMLERQARYVRQAVSLLADQTASTMDVREEVAAAFDDEVQRRLAGCRSWYRAGNGRVSTNWPGMVSEYHRRTRTLVRADFRVAA